MFKIVLLCCKRDARFMHFYRHMSQKWIFVFVGVFIGCLEWLR